MRKSSVAILLALLVTASRVDGTPTVYFSNYSGHQVLSVDATQGGAPTVVFSGSQIGSRNFSPEDMVGGPDGNLYISDPPNGLLWRFNPGLPVSTGSSPNPQVVVTFPSGVFPDGLAFSGNDDLYVNTRGNGTQPTGGRGAQGLWVVYNIAAPNTTPPYSALQIIQSFSNSGSGVTFGEFGNLLFADNAGSRVLSSKWNGAGSSPAFGPTFDSLVTTNITAPVGIAVNTCGDLLVASGTKIQRFGITKDASTGNFTAQFRNTYIDFGGTDVVMHIERDAANNVYAATNSGQAGGKIFKVTPVLDVPNNPIRSCATGTAGPAPIVALKDYFASSQAQAVGIAITPTDYPTSTPPGNVSIYAKSFDQLHTSNTYDFGHYRLTLTYKQVYNPFTQAFTALMSRPSDVIFDSSFPAGTTGMRFPSLGGFVVQLLTASATAGCASFAQCQVPIAGTDFAVTDQNGPAFTLALEFRDPINGFRNPGMAHSSINTMTGIFTDNVTADFWVLFDQATRGSGSIWGSKYVPFDSPFAATLQLPLTVTLNQPALSGNPLFNIGQNFTIAIVVTDRFGNPVPGLLLRVSAARLSPLPIELQTVRATNGAGNQMTENGNGKYSIGVDTSFFTGGTGTYQITIFGNGFPPYTFLAQFQQTVK